MDRPRPIPTCRWTGFYSDGALLWTYYGADATVVGVSGFSPGCIGHVGSVRVTLPCHQVKILGLGYQNLGQPYICKDSDQI